MGLSFAGLSVLPLSSVIPGPLPKPDTLISELDASAFALLDTIVAGEDVVGESLTLKRARFIEVVRVEGADFRFIIDGAVYERECGSTGCCDGGEVRACRLLLEYAERSSYARAAATRLSSDGHEEIVGCAVCG